MCAKLIGLSIWIARWNVEREGEYQYEFVGLIHIKIISRIPVTYFVTIMKEVE
jgi:hypothetical protein